jgi:hypothetical protein
VTTEVKDRPSYDDDFYAWTRDQAEHLRAQARLRKNEPIDIFANTGARPTVPAKW